MTDFSNMANKQDTPKIGVGVVLRDREGRVLLGKRLGSHGPGEYSLPGGHLEIGETFEDCCKREVAEETGIVLSRVIHIDFANNIMKSEGLHYVTLFFMGVWGGSQQVKNKEPDKCEGWLWYGELPSPMFGSSREIIEIVRLADQKS